MKKCSLTLLKIVFVCYVSLIFYACNDSSKEGDLESRSSSCVEELNYTRYEDTYVKFDVPYSDLSTLEQSLTVPKKEKYLYSLCKKASGTARAEIRSVSDPNAVGPSEHVGMQRQIEWHMINDDGAISVYDRNGDLIETKAGAPIIFDEALMADLLGSELLSVDNYNAFIEGIKNEFTFEEVNSDILMYSHTSGSTLVKNYVDHNLQREVVKEYYENGVMDRRTTSFFDIENDIVKLTNELHEVFSISPDSDKAMTIIKLYTYGQ